LLDRAPAWVTLVIPRFGVSTQDAYGWWDEARARREPRGRGFAGARARLDADNAETVNDLQGPVVRRHPEIARIIAALAREGAGQAALSGSGSAVFGIFGNRAAAVRAARAAGAASSRRTLVTRTINRKQYQALAGP
jgi:4-diphosphocytidyl-2-C-methyl-D-erythritol kinase